MGSSTESDSGATHAYDLATKELLQRYGDSPASLTVHLYPTHFRFGHQPGLFLKDSPGWEFLACLRDQRMPEDLRDVLGGGGGSGSSQLGLGGRGGGGGGGDSVIPFYDGCLIVELHDHRKASASRTAAASSTRRPMYPARHLDQELHSAGSEQQDEPEDQITICRIVLWPQEGSLAAELARLTPNDPAAALALEGRILALTQPLCLVADPAVCQAANLAWSATLPRPALPPTEPKKRKADLDLLHEARERRMRIMDESYGRSFTPTFSRLAMGQQLRESHSPDSSLALPAAASPAPPTPPAAAASAAPPSRSQHPLAQTHFPPSSNAPVPPPAPPSRNGSNLSVTIPARKSSAPPSKSGSPSSSAAVGLSQGASVGGQPPANNKKKGMNQYTKNKPPPPSSKQKKGKGDAASPPNAGTPVDTTGLGAWPSL